MENISDENTLITWNSWSDTVGDGRQSGECQGEPVGDSGVWPERGKPLLLTITNNNKKNAAETASLMYSQPVLVKQTDSPFNMK